MRNKNVEGNVSPHTQHLSKEEQDLWTSLSKEFTTSSEKNGFFDLDDNSRDGLHPAVAFGLFGALIAHGAIILSLPPVIRGKGAPFLPTASKGLNIMFKELRKQPVILGGKKNLTFLDLGSGDGRVVFRASREGLFHKSIGYEINPGTFVYICVFYIYDVIISSECCLLHLSIPNIVQTSSTWMG